jgi:hypothetical protein
MTVRYTSGQGNVEFWSLMVIFFFNIPCIAVQSIYISIRVSIPSDSQSSKEIAFILNHIKLEKDGIYLNRISGAIYITMPAAFVIFGLLDCRYRGLLLQYVITWLN